MATLLRLIMTRGLPASGKSTWAAEEKARLEANHLECVIVNKDDIRAELAKTGWTWSHKNEKDVIAQRDRKIEAALITGVSVISSDCNFGKHKDRLKQLAKEHGAEFEVKDFTHVPVDECVSRDRSRPADKQVGVSVIKEMYAKYLALPDVEPYVPDAGKPKALICDLDGTLALFKGLRGPYDYAKVANDKVNGPVAEIVFACARDNFQILYVSGREDSCMDQTKEFLRKHRLPNGPIFMRKTGDHRKDYLVKQELFDAHIRKQYNVVFALDDRDQVVKLWRGMGLTCLQVAEGDF